MKGPKKLKKFKQIKEKKNVHVDMYNLCIRKSITPLFFLLSCNALFSKKRNSFNKLLN